MKDLNLSLHTEMRNGKCWLIIRAGRPPKAEALAVAPNMVLAIAATVAHNTPGYEHLFDPILQALVPGVPPLAECEGGADEKEDPSCTT